MAEFAEAAIHASISCQSMNARSGDFSFLEKIGELSAKLGGVVVCGGDGRSGNTAVGIVW